jgi:hypothetical protein
VRYTNSDTQMHFGPPSSAVADAFQEFNFPNDVPGLADLNS